MKKILILGAAILGFALIATFNPEISNAKPDGSKGYTCSVCHPGRPDQTPPAPDPKPAPAPAKPVPAPKKAAPAPAKAAPTTTVAITVEGQKATAFKSGSTVFISVVDFAKAMGYTVKWDGAQKLVTLTDKFNNVVNIYTAKNTVNYRGKDNKVSTMIKNGSSFADATALTNVVRGHVTEDKGAYVIRKSAKTYQWENGVHAKILVEEDGVTRPADEDTCTACHNGTAFAKGKTKVAEVNNVVTPIDCNACHPTGSKAVKDLGGKRPFKLANGMTVNGGAGTVCINCHNSRRNNNDVEGLMTTYKAPHGGPQADVLFGVAGMPFGSEVYQKTPHAAIENTCVTCHMAEPENEYGLVGGHTYRITEGSEQNINACNQCHKDLTTTARRALGDYDGDKTIESIQGEVQGLQNLVKTELIKKYSAQGVTDLGEGGGNLSFVTKDGKLDPKSGIVKVNDYKAAWNLQVTINDSSMGIHNPAYVVQLLQQSYKAVTGKDVPNAAIR
ncbi:MAG: ammonia-forming cytochrome c nitrite reductase subunit c552 [Thermincola sp.]|jgi:hypothetical protein|nr:ammonia-forming cytochrome c nitrite reductase subunit c552 [Thermincola sp.]MDT3704488.1 ammonia-forming cytochrome c nitrite reductase subunit c552 [Thermincola sp.]